MALEDSVNTLVTNTTALLDAVNVSKATLDNSVTLAQAAATNAVSDAASAASSASSASTDADSASSSASAAAASAASASAIVTGVATGMPSVRPSLNLDFVNSKVVDPRITFARASTATYYDGKTVAKAEENLFKYSQEFDNAAWIKQAVSITTNSTTAPDGTLTAANFTGDGSSTVHYVRQSAGSGECVISIYAKQNTHNFVQIAGDISALGHVNFDLNLGTLSATTATGTISDEGNGWYRCTAVFSGSGNAYISLPTSLSALRYETNTLSTGIYLWGAQLENRDTVTAYTPTTSQPITNHIPVLQTAALNAPRLDYDPVTGEAKGLLIEESRTNLLTYSEDFSNAAWNKSNITIESDVTVTPYGTLSGDKLKENTATSTHVLQSGWKSFTAGTAYTLCVYAKAAEKDYLGMILPFSAFGGWLGATYNLTNGAVTNITANTSATATDVGNGWYRCTITATATTTTSTSTSVTFAVNTTGSSNQESYTGDGYSGIYIWGAQLEADAFPTSYIPTTSAQVTRAADSASMTGSNFSDWYRQDEGSVFVEAESSRVVNALSAIFSISSDEQNRIESFAASNTHLYVESANTLQANLDGGAFTKNVYTKLACGFKTNDFAVTLDGGVVATDISGNIPTTVDTLILGNNYAASEALRGHIKKFTYYPKRLADSELQVLTQD